jgi:hypothetical protein
VIYHLKSKYGKFNLESNTESPVLWISIACDTRMSIYGSAMMNICNDFGNIWRSSMIFRAGLHKPIIWGYMSSYHIFSNQYVL